MNNRPFITRQRQQGSTLIIALIFLVLLTMLGVTVATNNSLQERMAGNTRQRDIAFQAAEYALKAADLAINDTTKAARIYIDDANTHGGVAVAAAKPAYLALNGEAHHNDAAYWKSTFDWTTAASNPVAGIAAELVAADPRYIIEQMPSATCPDSPAAPAAPTTCYYYRVTAHGEGGDSNAAVILQAMYKFE